MVGSKRQSGHKKGTLLHKKIEKKIVIPLAVTYSSQEYVELVAGFRLMPTKKCLTVANSPERDCAPVERCVLASWNHYNCSVLSPRKMGNQKKLTQSKMIRCC